MQSAKAVHQAGSANSPLVIDLLPISYFHKTPSDWHYLVSSVSELPAAAASLDGMIIGGGHLIGFDKHIAQGYTPPVETIHHPTGYWLTPALNGTDSRSEQYDSTLRKITSSIRSLGRRLRWQKSVKD